MEKYFNGLRSVSMKVFLHVDDGLISVFPDVLFVAQFRRQRLIAEDLRMHPNDQHFLVIRTIKDTDPSAFGKSARRPPEKIVF